MFGLFFVLYFAKLSVGNGFWSKSVVVVNNCMLSSEITQPGAPN